MNATNGDSEEKWVPLEPGDTIFNTRADGNIAYYGQRAGTSFGARVRFKDGKWLKQIQPLQIMMPNEMLAKNERRTGAQVMAIKAPA